MTDKPQQAATNNKDKSNTHKTDCDAGKVTQLESALKEMRKKLEETEEKLASMSNQVMKSEARFKAIINQFTEGITVAAPDGKYIFVNDAFCSMIGYSEEEL